MKVLSIWIRKFKLEFRRRFYTLRGPVYTLSAVRNISDFLSYCLTVHILEWDTDIIFICLIENVWFQFERRVCNVFQDAESIINDFIERGHALSLNDALGHAKVIINISATIELEIKSLKLEAGWCCMQDKLAFRIFFCQKGCGGGGLVEDTESEVQSAEAIGLELNC